MAISQPYILWVWQDLYRKNEDKFLRTVYYLSDEKNNLLYCQSRIGCTDLMRIQ